MTDNALDNRDIIQLAIDYMTLKVPPQFASDAFETLSEHAKLLTDAEKELESAMPDALGFRQARDGVCDEGYDILTDVNRTRVDHLSILVLTTDSQTPFSMVKGIEEIPEHAAELYDRLMNGKEEDIHANRSSFNMIIASWFMTGDVKEEYRAVFPNHPEKLKDDNERAHTSSLADYIDGNTDIYNRYVINLAECKVFGEFPSEQAEADYLKIKNDEYMRNAVSVEETFLKDYKMSRNKPFNMD